MHLSQSPWGVQSQTCWALSFAALLPMACLSEKKKEKKKENTKKKSKKREKKSDNLEMRRSKSEAAGLTLLDKVCNVLVFLELLCWALVEEDQEGINQAVKVELVVQRGGHHLSHLQQTHRKLPWVSHYCILTFTQTEGEGGFFKVQRQGLQIISKKKKKK